MQGGCRTHSTAFPGASDQSSNPAHKLPRSSPAPSVGASHAGAVQPLPPVGQQPAASAQPPQSGRVSTSPLDTRNAVPGNAVAGVNTPPTFSTAGAVRCASAPPEQPGKGGVPAGSSTLSPIHADTIKGNASCPPPADRNQPSSNLECPDVAQWQTRAMAGGGFSDAERERWVNSCWLLANDKSLPCSRKGKGLAGRAEDKRSFSIRRGPDAGGPRGGRSVSAQQTHQPPRSTGGAAGGGSGPSALFATAAEVPRVPCAADDEQAPPDPAAAATAASVPATGAQEHCRGRPASTGAGGGQKEAPALQAVSAVGPDVAAAPQVPRQDAGAAQVKKSNRLTPAKRTGGGGAAGGGRAFSVPRSAAKTTKPSGTAVPLGDSQAQAHGGGGCEDAAASGAANGIARPSAAGSRATTAPHFHGGGITAAVTGAGAGGALVATGFTRGSGRTVMAPEAHIDAARRNRMLHDIVGQGEQ